MRKNNQHTHENNLTTGNAVQLYNVNVMNKANDTYPWTLNLKSLEASTNNAISITMLAMRIDMAQISEHYLLITARQPYIG